MPVSSLSIFAKKYQALYNSVSCKASEFKLLKKTFTNDVNLRCKQDKCYFNYNVSVVQVKACILLLTQHKHDGSGEYSSNHIIWGTEKLHVLLSLLFKGMLVHGYC